MADWLWSSLAAFAENMRVLAIFLVDGYIFVGIVIFLTGMDWKEKVVFRSSSGSIFSD